MAIWVLAAAIHRSVVDVVERTRCARPALGAHAQDWLGTLLERPMRTEGMPHKAACIPLLWEDVGASPVAALLLSHPGCRRRAE